MNKTINEEIELYFKYIESMKESICSLSSGKKEFTPHLKYLSCVGLIDTLAKCINNPNQKSNYKRFTNFINIFCGWNDCTRISLPHLVRFLQLIPSPDFEKLRKFANSSLAQWSHGKMHYLDSDPAYNEIHDLWPKDKEYREPVEKVSLESITHLSLFWKFRNSIVHELQIPGYGMLGLVTKKPGYHSMTNHTGINRDNPIETWELVYPVPFIMELITNGIKNLKQYCINNFLNPYDYYKFGSYWIDELN